MTILNTYIEWKPLINDVGKYVVGLLVAFIAARVWKLNKIIDEHPQMKTDIKELKKTTETHGRKIDKLANIVLPGHDIDHFY